MAKREFYKIDEDTVKDMARQVACIQAVLRNDADVEKISMYANVLASILDRLLTQRAADLPERCPKCEHIVTRHAHDCPRHHENTASR